MPCEEGGKETRMHSTRGLQYQEYRSRIHIRNRRSLPCKYARQGKAIDTSDAGPVLRHDLLMKYPEDVIMCLTKDN